MGCTACKELRHDEVCEEEATEIVDDVLLGTYFHLPHAYYVIDSFIESIPQISAV
jgi:hypothetical protein